MIMGAKIKITFYVPLVLSVHDIIKTFLIKCNTFVTIFVFVTPCCIPSLREIVLKNRARSSKCKGMSHFVVLYYNYRMFYFTFRQ
jgi:hypothetical protein